MMMMNGRSSRQSFTPSQWQELEHQALIYKYMASGLPIPSDLILPIRRSFLLDSTTMAMTSPSLAFPPQPSMGWGCFQLGFGRKAEDPEPGRCRRTDGKKWRCSKEAYPDSKYCERHMHRGKNRSRKPVEMSLANTLSTTTTTPSSSSSSSHLTSHYPPPPPLSISTPEAYHHHPLYPFSSSQKPQNNTTSYFQLDTHSYSSDKDYRYCFLSEASGGDERGSSWQFRPLGMNSFGDKEDGTIAIQQETYSQIDLSMGKEEEKQQQHCFVLGADFKLDKPVNIDSEHDTQKPLRHFFDEWPQKSKDSWLHLEGDYPKTHLSISSLRHRWIHLAL